MVSKRFKENGKKNLTQYILAMIILKYHMYVLIVQIKIVKKNAKLLVLLRFRGGLYIVLKVELKNCGIHRHKPLVV